MRETASHCKATTESDDRLPAELRPLFWDHPFEQLRWGQHRDFVIGRVLSDGDWNAVRWLRCRIGDQGLRNWIQRREGRGLSPQQLRFWELILKLPRSEVDRWLAARRAAGWDTRMG